MRLRRWVIAGAAIVVAVPALAYGYLAWTTKDAPRPATLQPAASSPNSSDDSTTTHEGTWSVVADAGFVGYRIRERLGPITAPSDAVGRSQTVSGTLSIAGTQIRSLDVSVDMTSLRSDAGGRDETMRSQGLQTDRFPESRFHLSEPLVIGQPSRGEVITASIRGDLTLHGQTHAVTIPIQARWDGPKIEVAGASRIRLADFGIDVSGLPGFKIESGGTIEFELTLSRSDSSAGGPGDTIVANPQTQTGEPTDQPCAATGQAPALPAALLFTAFPGDGVEVWIAGPGAEPAHRIVANATDAAWSPDATHIVYVTSPRGEEPPVLVIADRQGAQPIELGQPGAAEPDWSPDGTSIVFSKSAGGDGRTEIWSIGVDGSNPHRIAGTKSGAVGQPRWTPDGGQIIFTQSSPTTNDDVMIMNADGTGARPLFETDPYDYSGSIQDGRLLHVLDGRVHSADNASPDTDKPITHGPNDGDPALAADGTALAFVHQGNVYLQGPGEATCLPVGSNVQGGLRWSPATA